jgi:hypothetical protein
MTPIFSLQDSKDGVKLVLFKGYSAREVTLEVQYLAEAYYILK